jgi:hypothetical protein
MQKHNIEIGMGIALCYDEHHRRRHERFCSRKPASGMTFFGSYIFSVSDNIKICPELRVISFRYRGIVSLMPSISFRLETLRY